MIYKCYDDPYRQLANAIVLQAVEDYRRAKKKLKKHPTNKEAKLMIEDCEAFFRSDKFTILSDLDGEDILRRLSEE